jgi:hypothetical protein
MLTPLARPISTYGGRGCGKSGLTKGHHCIIYTGRDEPKMLKDEKPAKGEPGMMSSIRVHARDRKEKMFDESRVNFGKMYTVEHNVKVYDFGDVHKSSLSTLEKQWKSVINSETSKLPRVEEERIGEIALPTHGTAIYPYTATQEGYLSFEKDHRILVRSWYNDDWGKGRNETTGFEGLFPRVAYVKLDSPDYATCIKDRPFDKAKPERLAMKRDDRILVKSYVSAEWDFGYNTRTKKEGRYSIKWVKLDRGRFGNALSDLPFDPYKPNQLSYVEGDRILVTEWDSDEDEWSRGRNERTRQEGGFSSGDVELD